MTVSKRAAQVALQIVLCMTIIVPVVAMLAGCTLVINSDHINTEVVPAVSAVELAL